MKKLFVIAGVALAFTSCDQKTNETHGSSDTTTLTTTTADTSTPVSSNYNTTTNAYVPADGDVAYRNGKLMVWRNNAYVEADTDVDLDDSIRVTKNGEVYRNDNYVKLEEGEAVSKTGKFFNKAGEGIEKAWDATKKGVKKAAEGVKKAGQKVGEKVKEAVN